MNTRDYLRQTFALDRMINNKLRHIASLRELLTGSAATISDMPRNPSPANSRLESIMAEIVDLEEEVNQDIDRLADIKHIILNASYALEKESAQRIIECRYVKLMPWSQIYAETGYSKRQVYRLHDEALIRIKLPAD